MPSVPQRDARVKIDATGAPHLPARRDRACGARTDFHYREREQAGNIHRLTDSSAIRSRPDPCVNARLGNCRTHAAGGHCCGPGTDDGNAAKRGRCSATAPRPCDRCAVNAAPRRCAGIEPEFSTCNRSGGDREGRREPPLSFCPAGIFCCIGRAKHIHFRLPKFARACGRPIVWGAA